MGVGYLLIVFVTSKNAFYKKKTKYFDMIISTGCEKR